MYQPIELARFALSEFERGLDGLTDNEAQTRIAKADATEMNAISWNIGHIAGHWLMVAAYAADGDIPDGLSRFGGPAADPTPPSLDQMLDLLRDAKAATEWTADADDTLLAATREGLRLSHQGNIGTVLMRVILHTWFHTGEINAIRQLLGHPEIGFIGDVRGQQEWRSESDGTLQGYCPDELARFAISEFERGLQSVTDEEAVVRTPKPDGTQMNAITWTIGHVATGWLFDYALMTRERMPMGERLFFGAEADPTPPSLKEMRVMFADAKTRTEEWLPGVNDDLLSSRRGFGPQSDENLGTQLMRAVLHTWFHTGEINAVRQMLGHAEIPFVGSMTGKMEWHSPSEPFGDRSYSYISPITRR